MLPSSFYKQYTTAATGGVPEGDDPVSNRTIYVRSRRLDSRERISWGSLRGRSNLSGAPDGSALGCHVAEPWRRNADYGARMNYAAPGRE
jgi:hypothetical protein